MSVEENRTRLLERRIEQLTARLEHALEEGAKRREERDALQAKLDRLWEAFTAIVDAGEDAQG